MLWIDREIKQQEMMVWDDLKLWQRISRVIVNHKRFSTFITTVILMNTTIMCMYHYGMTEEFRNGLEVRFSLTSRMVL